ncbi:hypothetical protein D3C80_1323410 [compost metagenome]
MQPHGVGASGKGLGEGQFCTVLARAGDEGLRIGHPCLAQWFGEIDRLAVLAQAHEDCHFGGRAAQSQVGAIDLAIERVRGIQFAAQQSVAQASPGRLPLQLQGQAIGLGETLGGRDDQGGGVGKGHEAQVHCALFRGIAARDPGEVVVTGATVVGHVVCPTTERKRRRPSHHGIGDRVRRHRL